jgi:large subunit ribosomal protein L34e
MVRPSLRSTSLRKIRKKIPGGASIIHFFRKRPGGAVCAECGKPLHGVSREISSKIRKLSKSKKRPERPYGGKLCSECSRKKIKEKVR